MRFDPYAYAKEHGLEGGGRAIRATCAIQPAPNSTNSTISTDRPADTAKPGAVPCSTNSTNSTNSTGQASKLETGTLPPHVAAAVRAAFTDYAATDDPHDPRAWA